MKEAEAKKERGAFAKDLRDFGNLLAVENIIPYGQNPFESAANSCKDNSYLKSKGITNNLSWGYFLDRTIINLSDRNLKIRYPKNVNDISIEYTVEIIGSFGKEDHIEDPLKTLSFNIIINAKSSKDNNLKLKSCWHLDKSIESENEPSDIHPCYHFHFGGRNMQFEKSDYGTVLFMDPPRIAHKPLDAILATDFILSNFRSEDWKSLRNKGQYKNIVERSQRRLWYPYARATSEHWKVKHKGINWSSTNIWPQLVTVS